MREKTEGVKSTNANVTITTMEFNGDESDANMDGGKDKPKKNTNFTNYGDGAKGGQFKPPYKDDNNNTRLDDEKIGDKPKNESGTDGDKGGNKNTTGKRKRRSGGEDASGTDGKRRPPKQSDGEKKSDEDQEKSAVGGYGKPSKQDYNRTSNGYSMYGVYGQGEESKGYKKKGSGQCGDRQMIVTVTSNEDMPSDEVILLEVGSYTFFNSEEKAIKTGLAIATMAATAMYLY